MSNPSQVYEPEALDRCQPDNMWLNIRQDLRNFGGSSIATEMSYLLNKMARSVHDLMRVQGFWDDQLPSTDDEIHAEGSDGGTQAAIQMQVINDMQPTIALAKQMLICTELAEMAEAVRKPGPSDHCPSISGEAEEAADILVRLLDYCAARRIDLAGALVEKMLYNGSRPWRHGKLA